MTANAIEWRVVAFAEQIGRIAGTVQAKEEGRMDRDTLYQQIAEEEPGRGGARGSNKGRSGGVAPAIKVFGSVRELGIARV